MDDTRDEIQILHEARRLAHECQKVARDIATFADRMALPVDDAAGLAEFTALIAREEAVRGERDDAFAALGLTAPSVES